MSTVVESSSFLRIVEEQRCVLENPEKSIKNAEISELYENDFDRIIQCSDTMFHQINTNLRDECSFFLNGNEDKRNCRYWSDESLYIFREGHTQHPEKGNVWTGIMKRLQIPLLLSS